MTQLRMNSPASVSDADFAFAFDDSNFSDRLLRIEIVPDSKPDSGASADWALNRKRRRDDIITHNNSANMYMHHEEQILQCSMPDTEDAVGYENDDDDVAAMIEESPVGDGISTKAPGDEVSLNDVSSSNMDDGSDVVGVRALHISSPILAAKSPFFYKLFSSGMRESDQK